jgi:hypothetical protein
VTIEILGRDDVPPTITAVSSPSPNAAGWNSSPVTVTYTCSDSTSGIARCSAPVTVSAEGAGQRVRGVAVDRAGNRAVTSLTVDLDSTPPAIDITAPTDGSVLGEPTVSVTGTVRDDLSGLDTASLNGVPLAPQPGFDVEIGLSEGTNDLTVRAEDLAGNASERTVRVDLDPMPFRLEVLSPKPSPGVPLLTRSNWSLTLRASVDTERLAGFYLSALDDVRFPIEGDASFLVLEPNGSDCFIEEGGFPPPCAFETPYAGEDRFLEFRLRERRCALSAKVCSLDEDCDGGESDACLPPVPGLVILSNTGVGWVLDGGFDHTVPRTARNLAEFVDRVTYELRDSQGRTSVTAQLNAPYGLFAPRVQLDTCVGGPGCPDDFLMRVDGGEVATVPGSGEFLSLNAVVGIYQEVFRNTEFVVRVLLVNGTGPKEIPDSGGPTGGLPDGIVDASDVVRMGYELLADPVELSFSQLHPGLCGTGEPDEALFESVDLDENGGSQNFVVVCSGSTGNPGSLERPPD